MPSERDFEAPADQVASALTELHRRVRDRVARAAHQGRSPAPPESAPRNCKGDVVHDFDLAADDCIREVLASLLPGGVILSEESAAAIPFGDQTAALRFVVDPVDGSDNHWRALPLSAVSVAVLGTSGPLSLEAVDHALVGGLEEEEAYLARRGAKAWQGSHRLEVSGVRQLSQALVSCELNHCRPDPHLAGLLERCRGVRSYGCASRAIALVAAGRLDAHIDVRRRLTPESFLAAALLLSEAGGYLCTARGAPVGPFASLREPTSLIAAASEQLAREIVDALSQD